MCMGVRQLEWSSCWISTLDPFVLLCLKVHIHVKAKSPRAAMYLLHGGVMIKRIGHVEVQRSILFFPLSPLREHMHAQLNWACMCMGRTGGIALGFGGVWPPLDIISLLFILLWSGEPLAHVTLEMSNTWLFFIPWHSRYFILLSFFLTCQILLPHSSLLHPVFPSCFTFTLPLYDLSFSQFH